MIIFALDLDDALSFTEEHGINFNDVTWLRGPEYLGDLETANVPIKFTDAYKKEHGI